jgi:hypothetical protein
MAIKTLAAATLAASISTTAAFADTPQRSWLNTADWQVWSQAFDDGSHQACYAKHLMPTAKGFATFGFSQIDTRDHGTFHYSEDGLVWTQVGSLTVQVDGYAAWTFNASTNTERNQLTFGLGAQPAPFLSQLQFGSVVRIYTNNGVRVFSLAGSNQAIQTLISCVSSIANDRPRWTPLPAPQPSVVPLPPAGPYQGV